MHPVPASTPTNGTPPKRSNLYLQVLIGIVIGGVIGYIKPAWGIELKPLGDGFVSLVKMMIGPIIFTTVVIGLAGMSDLKRLGRVGLRATLYFELVSGFALVIGLIVANVFTPGAGFHADPASLDAKAVARYAGIGLGDGA